MKSKISWVFFYLLDDHAFYIGTLPVLAVVKGD